MKYWWLLKFGWTTKNAKEKKSCVKPFLLYEISRTGKFIETASRLVVARGWEESWGGVFNGHRVLFWDEERFWNWRATVLHHLVNGLNVTELYISKCLIACYLSFISFFKNRGKRGRGEKVLKWKFQFIP